MYSTTAKLLVILFVVTFVHQSSANRRCPEAPSGFNGIPVNTCKQDETCINGQCECQMGFIDETPFGPDLSCKPIQCRNLFDCSSIPNTRCGILNGTTRGQCVCRDGYSLNFKRIRCEPTRVTEIPQVEFRCSSDLDCGRHSVCISSNCQCKFGYERKNPNMSDCNLVGCSNNTKCENMFSNSQCNNVNECECSQHYHVEETTQKCHINAPSQFSCTYDRECGPNGMCLNLNSDTQKGICKCQLGFKSPWVERADGCEQVNCTSNHDCYSQFEGTRCSSASPRMCECDGDYTFDHSNQACVSKYASPTTEIPIKNSTVVPGINSGCTHNVNCTSNMLCLMDGFENKCGCPSGQHWNANTNWCDYDTDNEKKSSNLGVTLGSTFGSIALVLVIALVVWRFCCRARVTVDRTGKKVTVDVTPKPRPTIVHTTIANDAPSAPPQPPCNPAYAPDGGIRVYPNLNKQY